MFGLQVHQHGRLAPQHRPHNRALIPADRTSMAAKQLGNFRKHAPIVPAVHQQKPEHLILARRGHRVLPLIIFPASGRSPADVLPGPAGACAQKVTVSPLNVSKSEYEVRRGIIIETRIFNENPYIQLFKPDLWLKYQCISSKNC